MKLQVLSDLHFEFHKDGGTSFIESLDPTGVDVLVVAGDLTTETGLYEALAALSAKYPQVVYVAGNHEYYGSDRARVSRVRLLVDHHLSNVHWLHETAVEIDGQRFVGTTLWFPDDPLNAFYENLLNDFHQIRGYRRWVYEANGDAVAFLKAEVRPEDVVVTHHVPVTEGQHPKWRGTALERFFVNNLGNVVVYTRPKLWVYGHTHDSLDFHLGETRLVCNPFGYVRYEENPDYNEKLIVEV